MHAVGTETKTPVIDLHKVSVALYQKLGDEASADLTFGNADRTHFTRKGAMTMARFVAMCASNSTRLSSDAKRASSVWPR